MFLSCIFCGSSECWKRIVPPINTRNLLTDALFVDFSSLLHFSKLFLEPLDNFFHKYFSVISFLPRVFLLVEPKLSRGFSNGKNKAWENLGILTRAHGYIMEVSLYVSSVGSKKHSLFLALQCPLLPAYY